MQRHRAVNLILERELREAVHALSLQTLTATEWTRRGDETPASPACLGGSKTDQ